MNEAKPNINVTPLIDVLLVLLIIFMVVSPLKPTDFKAKIPQEPQEIQADDIPHPDTLIVSIASDSTIKLNNEKENFGSINDALPLTAKLKSVFNQRRQNMAFDESGQNIRKTVFIKAPRNLNYGYVIKVVDAVKLAGAEPISLQIDDLE
ncbi:MAG: biopolymer transporter ExbD [Pyrinomonadaceae bacterium]